MNLHTCAVVSAKKTLSLLGEYASQLVLCLRCTHQDEGKHKLLTALGKYCEGINKASVPYLMADIKALVRKLVDMPQTK
jgi:hypothetical protein